MAHLVRLLESDGSKWYSLRCSISVAATSALLTGRSATGAEKRGLQTQLRRRGSAVRITPAFPEVQASGDPRRGNTKKYGFTDTCNFSGLFKSYKDE